MDFLKLKITPMQLRNAIEIELQTTDDAKLAAIIALKKLKKDPDHYEGMQKAKYIRKLPDGKGGFTYIYKEEKKKTLKEKPTNQTDTKEFKAWFGDSKVVDKEGKPLVVYHGAKKNFKEFKTSTEKYRGSEEFSRLKEKEKFIQKGTFFSSSPVTADKYSLDVSKPKKKYQEIKDELLEIGKKIKEAHESGDEKKVDNAIELYAQKTEERTKIFPSYEDEYLKGSIYPVFLKMENPIIVDGEGKNWSKVLPEVYQKLDTTKNDGIIFKNIIEMNEEIQDTYVVFNPEQIKSATGNTGTFDPNNPDMTKAKDTSKLTKKVITNKLGKRQTVYVRLEEEKKEGWINKFSAFFGITNKALVNQKIKIDYNNSNIKEKFNISLDGWKNHVSEYFNNKNKWDKFFSGKKEKKDKPKKTEKKEVKKTEKKVKRDGLKLAVMKELFKLYGGKIEKEEEKSETSEQKTQDIKISKEINKVTPDTRNETEREIVGIPEPPPEEDIERPKSVFSPIDSEITIPFHKSGNPFRSFALDYTHATPKDIYLVSKKDILKDPKPDYIPEINKKYFSNSKYFLPTVKLEENKYVIKTDKSETYIRDGKESIEGSDSYVIVTREVLAATQDYYLKVAKAEGDKKHKEIEEKYGQKYKKKRVTIIKENRMTYDQSNFMNSFSGKKFADWAMNKEIRSDLKQKMSDMEIQLEEYYNAHAKGRETAYGDTGTKNNLLDDYGVKVKRQNGSEINDIEIQEIKSAMDDVFSVFGNRSSMAKNSNLKISHSGDKLMHARKAAGLYMHSINAIGITAKYGQKGTGFILAHEWSHFMDHYLGDKVGRNYVSDDPTNIAGEIADIFRKNMAEPQKSVYQRRTCECFARAMEQYWAIKTENKGVMSEWDNGNHPSEEVFKEKLMPLIDKFFTENDKLLKAMFKRNNKFYRRVG